MRRVLITLLGILFLAGCASTPESAEEFADVSTTCNCADCLFYEGYRMTDEQVALAEERLRIDPNDERALSLLIIHYSRDWQSETKLPYLLKLISINPAAPILEISVGNFDHMLQSSAYNQVSTAWEKALTTYPENVGVLHNAAEFYLIEETELAIQLLKKATSLDAVNAELHDKLALAYYFEDRFEDALMQYEKVIELTNSEDVTYNEAAKMAYLAGNKAKVVYYVKKMEEMKLPAEHWNYSNTIHDINLYRGMMELDEGNVENARVHLVDSVGGGKGPQISSFGPDMSLAKRFYDLGERELVVEYLKKADAFWDEDLEPWIEDVQSGREPDWRYHAEFLENRSTVSRLLDFFGGDS